MMRKGAAVANSSSKSLRKEKENEKKATLTAEIARMREEMQRQQLMEDIREMEAAIAASEQSKSKTVRSPSGGTTATAATVSSTVRGDSEHGGAGAPAPSTTTSTTTASAARSAASPKKKKTVRKMRPKVQVRHSGKKKDLPVESSHSQMSSTSNSSYHTADQGSVTDDSIASNDSNARRRLEEEIRAMEVAIAFAAAPPPTPPQAASSLTPAERLDVEIRNMQTALLKAQAERQGRRKVPKDGSNNDVHDVSQIHYVRTHDTYYDSDENTMDDTTLDDDDYYEETVCDDETVMNKAAARHAVQPGRSSLMAAFASAAAEHNDEYYEETVCDDETVTHHAAPAARPAARQAPAVPVQQQQPVRPNLMAALASAATERTQRLEATGGKAVMHSAARRQAPVPPASSKQQPSKPNWLADMAVAATARVQRLEDGGELFMGEHKPEVAAQRQITPQLSTSLAEAVAKKAADRDKRIAAGGEKRMTVVKEKEKEDYKQTLASIFNDAAKLGRLTRLDEHCVEAVAGQKQAVQAWESKGLLAIRWNYRSKHMSVIHEAAAAGHAAKLPENVVSNAPEEQRDYDYNNLDQELSPRMLQLLELNTRAGTGQNKVDSLVMGRKEEKTPDALLVKPMHCYSSFEEILLPKKRTPKINPAKARAIYLARLKAADNEHRPLTSISNDVATLAWERRSRLDRPGQVPRVTGVCSCPYCFDASPFQTVAYMVKEGQRKEEGYESPDSDEEHDQKLEDHRAARRKERQAAMKLSQPLSIREALEETHTAMPVRQRIKAMNTAPTSRKIKPVQSAVISDYRKPKPVDREVWTRVIPSQPKAVAPAPVPVSRSPPSLTATELLEAEIRDMQNALLKAEEEAARVPKEPKSVASTMRRKKPRGANSVASKAPSVASRRKPVPSQGSVSKAPSVAGRLKRVSSQRSVSKAPSVAGRHKRVSSQGSMREMFFAKKPAPPVPTSVEITVDVEVKAPPTAVRQPKTEGKTKAPPKAARQPKTKAPPKIKVKETRAVRQPFQGSQDQPFSTAPVDKSYDCTIM